MAKEADQTRWVGVRPTDPSEDIPTTTKKVLPAVADLQAVQDSWRAGSALLNKDCTVSYIVYMVVVPAGYVYVVNNFTVRNKDSMCDIECNAFVAGGDNILDAFYSIPAGIIKSWHGTMVLMPGERISYKFLLGGLTDDVEGWARGYRVALY